jgi:hypothetical protein
MKIRFSVEFRVSKDAEPVAEQPQPQGTESSWVHQDQPRYIGFMPQGGTR